MKWLAIAMMALPLGGCLVVNETAREPERRVVRTDSQFQAPVSHSADVQTTYVRSVRVPATDVAAVADFYKSAFGMHEIRRLGTGASTQIVLNTGSGVEDAAANPHSPIVIVTRPAGMEVGILAALIMNVPDVDSAIASVVAAGGSIVRPKTSIPNGPTFGFVKDPEGNQLELILAN